MELGGIPEVQGHLGGGAEQGGQDGGPATGAADDLVGPRWRLRWRCGPAALLLGAQGDHAAVLAGQDGGAAGWSALRDKSVDQGFGQQVALFGEPGGTGCRGLGVQRGLELGGFLQRDQAGGVGPVGQAPDAGG